MKNEILIAKGKDQGDLSAFLGEKFEITNVRLYRVSNSYDLTLKVRLPFGLVSLEVFDDYGNGFENIPDDLMLDFVDDGQEIPSVVLFYNPKSEYLGLLQYWENTTIRRRGKQVLNPNPFEGMKTGFRFNSKLVFKCPLDIFDKWVRMRDEKRPFSIFFDPRDEAPVLELRGKKETGFQICSMGNGYHTEITFYKLLFEQTHGAEECTH
jgi:hypothetical protein